MDILQEHSSNPTGRHVVDVPEKEILGVPQEHLLDSVGMLTVDVPFQWSWERLLKS